MTAFLNPRLTLAHLPGRAPSRAMSAAPAARWRWLAALALLAAAALLQGCATTWRVDSDVRTFSTLPALQPGSTYRFERLPSQQAHGEQQQALESIAQQSLARYGLRRDDAAAQYSVQIGARAQREASPWEDNWLLPGRDYVVNGAGQVVWVQSFARPELPWFRREVSVVIRDLRQAGKVVYETQAAHEGRWADSSLILPALFDSALTDFPQATTGVKRVSVTVPLK
jgi:hypothetical protein